MHLAFEEYGGYGVGTRVFYALRGSSGSWSEPEVVADGEMPALALDPDGEVYAAVEGTLGVEVWKKQSGGWEKKAELGFTDGGSGLPDLHVDTNGRFHVTLNRSRIGPQDSRGFYYVVLCPQG